MKRSTLPNALFQPATSLLTRLLLLLCWLCTSTAFAALPEVTIIIDDMGNNRRLADRVLALDSRITLAVIPHTPYATYVVDKARERQQELMLHLPMESTQKTHLAGPWQLKSSMDKRAFLRMLDKNLQAIDGYVGVNNHMGSRLMRNAQALDWLMAALSEKSLFFVDSKTVGGSRASELGAEHGIDTAARDIFLDTINTPKFINRQFDQLLKRSRAGKRVIAIGHPYPHTIDVLAKRIKELDRQGIRLVSMQTQIHLARAEQPQQTAHKPIKPKALALAADVSDAASPSEFTPSEISLQQTTTKVLLGPSTQTNKPAVSGGQIAEDILAARQQSGIDLEEEMLLDQLATE